MNEKDTRNQITSLVGQPHLRRYKINHKERDHKKPHLAKPGLKEKHHG